MIILVNYTGAATRRWRLTFASGRTRTFKRFYAPKVGSHGVRVNGRAYVRYEGVLDAKGSTAIIRPKR